jgi:very-short-patch-repair endonuclease
MKIIIREDQFTRIVKNSKNILFGNINELREKMTTDEFIEKSQKKHQNPDGTPKYDYSDTIYDGSDKIVKINCLKHGPFTPLASNHLRGDGCKPCGIESSKNVRTMTTDEFIKKAQKVHQNPDGTPKYDYSNTNYIHSKTDVIINCPKHRPFPQLPSNHLRGDGCSICRESKGESTIHKYIIQEYGYEIIPQKKFEDCTNVRKGKKICREYQFDFYLPQLNTIIEFDGEQHFSKKKHFHKTDERFQEQVEDDIFRVNYCKNKCKLIRISYNEKDILGELDKGLKSNKKLWLSDNYPKLGWNA